MSRSWPIEDAELAKLYAYGRLLIGKLQIDDDKEPLLIDDDVQFSYYRRAKTHEGPATLQVAETGVVYDPKKVGTGRPKQEDEVPLSELVDVLNEKSGTDFTAEDQLLFNQILGDLKHDDQPGDQARNNTIDPFKLAFDPKGMAAVLSRMERNEDIANQFMSNEQLRAVALELMMQQDYEHFKGGGPEA